MLSKKTLVDLGGVTDVKKQCLVAETVNAFEDFANLDCVACGVLQILALNYLMTTWRKYTGRFRTKRTVVPSEEIVVWSSRKIIPIISTISEILRYFNYQGETATALTLVWQGCCEEGQKLLTLKVKKIF